MYLHNTLTRKKEEIKPIVPGKIGLYACGFTAYDYTHLGHLRKYSMDDVLIRVLRHEGFEVNFVQNVTDVGHLSSDQDTGEDKLEKGAKKYNQSVWDIAKRFEEYFFYSMDEMGNLRPDVSCRATDHIQEQIELVQMLESKGYTYVIEGDGVYFDASKFPTYGELAKLNLENLKEGARVEMVAGKKNPTDFALWKFERPGENRAMVWPSPWAERGFPGWHIECSAMSMKYLGEQFDIHTGGIDHIPVHHTNEIAQSEAATGKKPFVKYWVHHNHLMVEGEKMSKSLGNFYTIDDVKKRNISPVALRLLLLTTHYRSEMNFTWSALAGQQKMLTRLAKQYSQLLTNDQANSQSSDIFAKYQSSFFERLNDDLDTPRALTILWQVFDDAQLSATEKLSLINEFGLVLGVDWQKVAAELAPENSLNTQDLPEEVRELLAKRQLAKDHRDFTQSDALREQLIKLGYQVIDKVDNSQELNLIGN